MLDIPPIVLAVVGFVVIAVMVPVVAVNAAEGVRAIDPDHLEMARARRAGRRTIRDVVLPTMASPQIAGLAQVTVILVVDHLGMDPERRRALRWQGTR